jgi:hypothetical protein
LKVPGCEALPKDRCSHFLQRPVKLIPCDVVHESLHVRQVEKFARPCDRDLLILLSVEVTGSGIYRDDEIGTSDERAFQESIVWFVPDDMELSQRMTHAAHFNNLSDQVRPVTQNVCVFLKTARLAQASSKPMRASSKISADALFSPGNVASFRMQVSRTTRKVEPGATQCTRTTLRFDECDGLRLGHRLPAVLAVRPRQRARELEPNNFPVDDGRRIHNIRVRK